MAFLKNKLAVTIIVLSVSFLILITVSVAREKVSVVESGVGSTLNAIQKVTYNSGNTIKNYISFLFSFSKVKLENEELKKINSELEQKLIENKFDAKEYETLKAMFDFKSQRSDYNYIGCNIIGKSGGNFLDGFIIDKGTKDNIRKDMVVITAEGLVGQVTSTAINWSVVQSISNENIAVSAMVESTNETGGILRGYKDENNKLLSKLYDLPKNSQVEKGDVILTSGHGNLYPKGIRIGHVVNVEEDKGKIAKNAVVEPFVDFNKLEAVFIVIPQDIRDIKY